MGVPAVAQWIKNPTVASQVTAEGQVQSPAQCSRLKRIWRCWSSSFGCSCGSDSILGPGTSICSRFPLKIIIIIIYIYIPQPVIFRANSILRHIYCSLLRRRLNQAKYLSLRKVFVVFVFVFFFSNTDHQGDRLKKCEWPYENL